MDHSATLNHFQSIVSILAMVSLGDSRDCLESEVDDWTLATKDDVPDFDPRPTGLHDGVDLMIRAGDREPAGIRVNAVSAILVCTECRLVVPDVIVVSKRETISAAVLQVTANLFGEGRRTTQDQHYGNYRAHGADHSSAG